MGTASSFVKDPNAVLDYQVNWSTWLGADTIQSSSWVVPAGITKTSESNTTTTATVWLSGGTAGQEYLVVNRIVTVGGRTEDRGLRIVVAEL
jgi:hypothetical protein